MTTENTRLSEDIVVYLGFDRSASITSSWNGIPPEVVPSKQDQLRVMDIVKTLDSYDIDWSKHDYDSAINAVRKYMTEQYPELTGRALDALVWRFSYSWR